MRISYYGIYMLVFNILNFLFKDNIFVVDVDLVVFKVLMEFMYIG